MKVSEMMDGIKKRGLTPSMKKCLEVINKIGEIPEQDKFGLAMQIFYEKMNGCVPYSNVAYRPIYHAYQIVNNEALIETIYSRMKQKTIRKWDGILPYIKDNGVKND